MCSGWQGCYKTDVVCYVMDPVSMSSLSYICLCAQYMTCLHHADTSSMNDGSVEASLLETFLANNALSAGCDMRMDGLPKPQICFDFTKGVCTRGDKCK